MKHLEFVLKLLKLLFQYFVYKPSEFSSSTDVDVFFRLYTFIYDEYEFVQHNTFPPLPAGKNLATQCLKSFAYIIPPIQSFKNRTNRSFQHNKFNTWDVFTFNVTLCRFPIGNTILKKDYLFPL